MYIYTHVMYHIGKPQEKQHPWIEKEKGFFGKKGTDFDFEANSYQENKSKYDEIAHANKSLSKSINKKAPGSLGQDNST